MKVYGEEFEQRQKCYMLYLYSTLCHGPNISAKSNGTPATYSATYHSHFSSQWAPWHVIMTLIKCHWVIWVQLLKISLLDNRY